MRLITLRTAEGTTAARLTGDNTAVKLDFKDLSELLAQDNWEELAAAEGEEVTFENTDLDAVVPRPRKVVCVGLNLSLIHISEPTRREWLSRMPSSA